MNAIRTPSGGDSFTLLSCRSQLSSVLPFPASLDRVRHDFLQIQLPDDPLDLMRSEFLFLFSLHQFAELIVTKRCHNDPAEITGVRVVRMLALDFANEGIQHSV